MDSLQAAGRRLTQALTGVEEAWSDPTGEVQGITGEGDDVVSRLGSAHEALASSFDAPTEAQMTRLERAEERLRRAVERTNGVFTGEVADSRRRARDVGLEFFPEKEPLEAGV